MNEIRFGDEHFVRVDTRQTLVRLTVEQRGELDWALSDRAMSPALVRKVEDALERYQSHRRSSHLYATTPQSEERARRARVKCLAELKALHESILGVGHLELKRLLGEYIAERYAVEDMEPISKGKHRPIDSERWTLAGICVWALDDDGFPLTAGRPDASVVVRVLQLVLRWADVIDGKPPRDRTNLYSFAVSVIRKYKPWRVTLEREYDQLESQNPGYQRPHWMRS